MFRILKSMFYSRKSLDIPEIRDFLFREVNVGSRSNSFFLLAITKTFSYDELLNIASIFFDPSQYISHKRKSLPFWFGSVVEHVKGPDGHLQTHGLSILHAELD